MIKYLSILIVLALVVAGFAYYTLFAGPNREIASQVGIWSENSQPETEIAQQEVEELRTGKASLQTIRDWNKDIECSVKFVMDDFIANQQPTAVEGTYFVSQGNIRGDFLTPSPDLQGTILSSMIISGNIFYVWSEIAGEQFGVKGTVQDSSAVEMNQEINMDSEVSYDCKPWQNVDKTIFVPPSGVLFKDETQLFEAGMEYGTVYTEE